mmetsp:Transcript_13964/g.13739  ORF Transcript_13964/g.13739 Transcript_13964/m.13739 type:complete len:215 (+) Transcript_13964:129-773(+)
MIDSQSGNSLYQLGLTEFATMTDEEFKKLMVCNDHISRKVARIIDPDSEEGIRLKKKLRVLAPPKSVDWRAAGAVTPVRKQTGCGCCYAMATTEATEGIFQIKQNKLIQLSVQQIVDCSASFGNEGCKGGFQVNSYHYIEERGVVSESAYPYVAAAGTCKTTTTRDATFTFATFSTEQSTIALHPPIRAPGVLELPIFGAVFILPITSDQHAVR